MARFYRVTIGTISETLPLSELVTDEVDLSDLAVTAMAAFRSAGLDPVGVTDSAAGILTVGGSLFGGNFGGNF